MKYGLKIFFAFLLLCICQPSAAQLNRTLRSQRQVVRGGMVHKPDSLEIIRRDSAELAVLVDSLRKISPDSLSAMLSDSIKRRLPADLLAQVSASDTLRLQQMRTDSLQRDSLAAVRRAEQRGRKGGFLSDSTSLRKMCWTSAILPGFGQIYNKQYWKLPILYGTLGASLGMFIHENNKYKPLKRQYDALTDVSLSRTPELDALQRKMIQYNTWREVFLCTAAASYIYFIGDAAVNYATNEVSDVSKATTLSIICPGAGQIYNKSYWRVPIVLGGFATMVYCIDWNNRGYQRFKKAYRLRYQYDESPDSFPNGSPDEFQGRYSATFLKNLRNSYRRNRDLCIIMTAGLYILQIVDAHVDAHLKDYDISDDLSFNMQPMINYAYSPAVGGNRPVFGAQLNINF